MTFEAFWEIYIEEDLFERYDAVRAVFGQALDPGLAEEYALEDVLITLLERLEEAKDYAKIEELKIQLKEKNNWLYRMVGAYFDDTLIEYYCFHRDEKALEAILNDFLEAPLEDYEILERGLEYLLYYEYTDLVEKVVAGTYSQLLKSDDYTEDATSNLARMQFDIDMKRVYENYQSTQQWDWGILEKRKVPFDYEIGEGYTDKIEYAFEADGRQLKQALDTDLKEKRIFRLIILRKGFMKYALAYNIPIATSGSIWDKMVLYWKARGRRPSKYFDLEKKPFKAFVVEQTGLLIPYHMRGVLILWGSLYVYDFLLSVGLVPLKQYQEAVDVIKEYKKAFANEFQWSLWKYDFVCNWKKAAASTSEEKDAEEKIFRASFPQTREEENVTEYFFNRLDSADLQELQSLLEQFKQSEIFEEEEEEAPKIALPKIGRNEKVTVRYIDGTLKKGIKYKKVIKDLEQGKCELIDRK